jgi:cyclophilin family peptidyl-prolyl cis-trans isomerase
MKRLLYVVSVLAVAGGCEKSKPTSEEAPIKPGSTINRPPPPPIDAPAPQPDAAEAAIATDGDAGTLAAEVPGGSAPAGATDELRPPVAADLAVYTAGIPGKGKLMAAIVTSMGTFNCELYEDVPMTVANFVGLATGKKTWKDPNSGEIKKNVPFFNGIIFHRVIPDFMVQVGDPLGQGIGGPGYEFDNEIVPKYKHDVGGILSMANAGPGTNGSQFFITEKATPWLDGKHTVFGKCAEVDLVKKITGVPKDGADKPTTPVTIKSVKISRK